LLVPTATEAESRAAALVINSGKTDDDKYIKANEIDNFARTAQATQLERDFLLGWAMAFSGLVDKGAGVFGLGKNVVDTAAEVDKAISLYRSAVDNYGRALDAAPLQLSYTDPNKLLRLLIACVSTATSGVVAKEYNLKAFVDGWIINAAVMTLKTVIKGQNPSMSEVEATEEALRQVYGNTQFGANEYIEFLSSKDPALADNAKLLYRNFSAAMDTTSWTPRMKVEIGVASAGESFGESMKKTGQAVGVTFKNYGEAAAATSKGIWDMIREGTWTFIKEGAKTVVPPLLVVVGAALGYKALKSVWKRI